LQCRAEELQLQKAAADQAEAAKQKRKLPLTDCHIRRFYTRTRGVPEHCLRERQLSQAVERLDSDDGTADDDRKMPAPKTVTPIDVKNADSLQEEEGDDDVFLAYCDSCPLIDGTYFILPRSWCHGWRRFMKTGEGGGTTYSPPDAAGLLCDAHRMALLPPHLESFLYGETTLLLGGQSSRYASMDDSSPSAAVASSSASLPVGQGPTRESILAMRSLGLNEQEVALQLSAMRTIEARQRRQASIIQPNDSELAAASVVSRNELLDRENHSVVEVLTQAEFNALEACWPGTTVFGLRFTVDSGRVAAAAGGDVCSRINFCTPVCRSCDATGRQYAMSIKNRARSWVRKSADKLRAPASLAEY
jgi:hypothetical protein